MMAAAWPRARALVPLALALGGLAFVGHALVSLRGEGSAASAEARAAATLGLPQAPASPGLGSLGSEQLLVAQRPPERMRPPRPLQPAPQGQAEPPAASKDMDTAKYGALLEERMREESPSGAWATQAEGELSAAFESPSLADSRLLSAECRQSMCRLEYEHRDGLAQQNFTQGILQHPVFLDTSLFTRATDDTGLRYVAFLARQGTELPAPPSSE